MEEIVFTFLYYSKAIWWPPIEASAEVLFHLVELYSVNLFKYRGWGDPVINQTCLDSLQIFGPPYQVSLPFSVSVVGEFYQWAFSFTCCMPLNTSQRISEKYIEIMKWFELAHSFKVSNDFSWPLFPWAHGTFLVRLRKRTTWLQLSYFCVDLHICCTYIKHMAVLLYILSVPQMREWIWWKLSFLIKP